MQQVAAQLFGSHNCILLHKLKQTGEREWYIRQFLLELGGGGDFVSSQYYLEVGGEDFYLDLLFYHLKVQEFRPEAGTLWAVAR